MAEQFELSIYSKDEAGEKVERKVMGFRTSSPYFAIHPSESRYYTDPPVLKLWTLTHIATGLCLFSKAPSYGLACAALYRILLDGKDWSFNAKEDAIKPECLKLISERFSDIEDQMMMVFQNLSGIEFVVDPPISYPEEGLSKPSELDKLGHSLAYESAVSVIECHSLTVLDGEDEWLDISGEEDKIAEDVRYLEMRGLLERHAVRPLHVRLIDESEATA